MRVYDTEDKEISHNSRAKISTSNGSEPRVVFTDLGFWGPEGKILKIFGFFLPYPYL